MRIAYMPDTHFGPYDGPVPSREDVSFATDQLLEESELAERAVRACRSASQRPSNPIRTRNPRPETGHYPDRTESLECIARLGEEVVRPLGQIG